ncbi:MAG: hypothetical protein AAF638_07035, partial [Pseudomonadota bacterium]
MEIRADFLELAQRVGIDLVDHVTARDELYLRPSVLTRVAARRFRSGLKSLAAYLRRLILLLALQMEHGLVERAPQPVREKRSKWPSPGGFRVLPAPYRPDIYTSHTPNPRVGVARYLGAPILGSAGASSGMWGLEQRALSSLERDPSRRRSGNRALVPSGDLFAAL